MQLLFFVFLCFFCNMIQIIGAFGGTMLSMPFAILMFGAMDAKLIMNGVSMLACIYPIFRCWKQIQLRELLKIVLFMLLGAGIAQLSGPVLYSNFVLLLYSLMVLAVGISNFFPQKKLSLPKWADYGILLLAGLIHGAFLSGGSCIAIYSMRNFQEKDQMRSTISAIWLAINGFLLGSSIAAGNYTPRITGLVLLGLLPAAAGIAMGEWLQRKLDQKRFRLFVNIMLLISGFILLYNCIFG